MSTLRTLAVTTILGSMLAATHATPASYKIDPVHSYVLVKLSHMSVGNSWGRFDEVSGTVVNDEANPANSAVNIEIKADSIDTNNPKRDQHLRGPDFFNTKEFPTIKFVSKEVKKVDDHSYEITGDITVHGVTKTITVPATITGSGKDPKGTERAGAEVAFKLKRSEFGINYMPGALGEDAEIQLDVEGIKEGTQAAVPPAASTPAK